MEKFVFIGGGSRGYELAEKLVKEGLFPKHAFILKEDDHELEIFSDKIFALFKNTSSVEITKKLDEENYKLICSSSYSFGIVCGWRTIIKLSIIQDSFKYGLLAAHDSLLPKYRGFAPTNWAIINGENECGVSIFKISKGEVDSGDIFFQEKCTISPDDTINDVMKKVTASTINGYLRLFKDIHNVKPQIQDESKATYTCKRGPNDGLINWNESSLTVHNLVRGLALPYPNAFTFYNGVKIFVSRARIGKNNDKVFVGKINGKILSITSEYVEVLCDKGTIEILEIRNEKMEILPLSTFKSITHTLG